MNINFKVIGPTRFGIKPKSTAPEANALTTQPSELLFKSENCRFDLENKTSYSHRIFISKTACILEVKGSIIPTKSNLPTRERRQFFMHPVGFILLFCDHAKFFFIHFHHNFRRFVAYQQKHLNAFTRIKFPLLTKSKLTTH